MLWWVRDICTVQPPCLLSRLSLWGSLLCLHLVSLSLFSLSLSLSLSSLLVFFFLRVLLIQDPNGKSIDFLLRPFLLFLLLFISLSPLFFFFGVHFFISSLLDGGWVDETSREENASFSLSLSLSLSPPPFSLSFLFNSSFLIQRLVLSLSLSLSLFPSLLLCFSFSSFSGRAGGGVPAAESAQVVHTSRIWFAASGNQNTVFRDLEVTPPPSV